MKTITPQDLNAQRLQGEALDLIDVRTPVEFREVHVDFARNVPLDRLDPQEIRRERANTADRPLYVICRSGSRGKQACETLQNAGLGTVVNVEGGTAAWEAAGLPVIRGPKGISLERQVRIAAGLLVIVGTALGAFLHSGLLGIAGFVGAGLVFAGVTDRCGMALLLGRMPWNQVREKFPAGPPAAKDTCGHTPAGPCCG